MKKLIIVLALIIAIPVLAADYLPKESTKFGAVTVSGPEIYHNLYLAGGSVSVNSDVTGDLMTAGGSVNIGATVEKDLTTAGGNVNINRSVGDDVRAVGGNVNIAAPIAGDLLVAGGTVNVDPSTVIGDDLWVGAGILNFNGTVKGGARIAGGEILINGIINGDVTVRASKQLVFGPQSRVFGKINYSGPMAAVIQSGAQVGPINFAKTAPVARVWSLGAFLGLALLIKLLALALVGLLIWHWFRSSILNLVAEGQARPWGNLARGFITLIIWPLVAILTLLTVVGAYLGAILFLLFFLTLLIAATATVFFLGSLVEKWIWHKEANLLTWPVLVWGLLAGLILSFVPAIGWLILFLAYFITLGSLLRTGKQRLF